MSDRRPSGSPQNRRFSSSLEPDRAGALKQGWSRAARVSVLWVLAAGTGIGLAFGYQRLRSPAHAKAPSTPRVRPAALDGPDESPAASLPPGAPEGFQQPINTDFPGVVCFRGNAQRNYYGEGPAPRGNLKIRWSIPVGADPAAPQWNGIGWTGQPLAVEWPESVRAHMNFTEAPGPRTEIIAGGMDSSVHFVDADTGRRSRPALRMPFRNPIKGTVAVDPRGYPLLYVGGALARPQTGYRIFSLTDFKQLALIPGGGVGAPRGWPAFDSNALILDDQMLLPGENGLFYKVQLNARWDAGSGRVSVSPRTRRVPITPAGIEASLAVWEGNGYCSDSNGGLFRIPVDNPARWKKIRSLGDDADTTPTFDTDGTFYVGIQVDHRRSAGAKGSLFKLRAPDGEVVWRYDFPAQSFHGSSKIHDINGGVLSTAAVWPQGNLVFVTTAHHPRMGRGSIVALDRETGAVRWEHKMRGYAWGSPTVVDGVVAAADASGYLYVRDAATGRTLLEDNAGAPLESFELGHTVEASPLIWKGRIYLGVRGGALLCIGPADEGEI